jgi:hypothetical protein
MGLKWEWNEDERSDETNTRTWKSGAATFVCSLSASRSRRCTLAPTSRNSCQSLYSDLVCSTVCHGTSAVPSRCTNLQGNRRHQASAMRTHRPHAVRLCNSAAWVRTRAWRSRRTRISRGRNLYRSDRTRPGHRGLLLLPQDALQRHHLKRQFRRRRRPRCPRRARSRSADIVAYPPPPLRHPQHLGWRQLRHDGITSAPGRK